MISASLGCAASGSDDKSHGQIFGPNDASTLDAASATDGSLPGDDATTPPPDGSVPPHPDASTDAGVDAPIDAVDSGSCTDKTAVVAGNGSTFYEALAVGAGAWTVASAAAPALSAPALVATGSGGFHAVVRTTGDALQWTATSGGAWSALAGVSGATTPATPALAALATSVHLVYLGSNGKYYHGTFATNAWDGANDPVGGAGALQSFGPTAVGLASVGGALLFSHRGGTSAQLYAEGWAAGVWSASAVDTAMVDMLIPATIPMVGATDAMILYVHAGDYRVSYATRAGGSWSNKGQIDTTLFTDPTTPVAAAPIPGGGAVVVFRGSNKKAYGVVYNGTTWALPATQLATGDLGGLPAVSPGACGDDAVAILPMAAGDAQTVRLKGGTWSAPAPITGASAVTGVAIATSK